MTSPVSLHGKSPNLVTKSAAAANSEVGNLDYVI